MTFGAHPQSFPYALRRDLVLNTPGEVAVTYGADRFPYALRRDLVLNPPTLPVRWCVSRFHTPYGVTLF